jgi:hypothetical protein
VGDGLGVFVFVGMAVSVAVGSGVLVGVGWDVAQAREIRISIKTNDTRVV